MTDPARIDRVGWWWSCVPSSTRGGWGVVIDKEKMTGFASGGFVAVAGEIDGLRGLRGGDGSQTEKKGRATERASRRRTKKQRQATRGGPTPHVRDLLIVFLKNFFI
jgi:hypothetical protein